MTQYAQLPKAPTVTNLDLSQNVPTVGLAAVEELRADEKGGTAGGVKIAIGRDLRDYPYSSIKRSLNEKKFKVLDAPHVQEINPSELPQVLQPQNSFALLEICQYFYHRLNFISRRIGSCIFIESL